MQTTIKQNKKRMSISDILEVTLGGTVSALLIFSKKITISVFGISYINPEIKAFISDVTPILGFLTGIATLILLIYKIRNARKELKSKK